MTPKQLAFQSAAESIIKNLEKRNMEGYFFETGAECVKAITDLIEEDSQISWGGSESIKECGLLDALKKGNYTLIDRLTAKSPEESRELYVKAALSDYYLMSTNAITMDGELINIDGNGNRVACLIHGPKHIIIVAGMNKVVSDVEAGYARVRDIATPANTKRLNKNTPCFHTGRCGDCLSPECICNQVVITRRSGHPGRIKVFLVAEDLGY
ncbi:MAG: lactate utilization protein [Lachnospiraceae bacterium]|nr:lactate utilization protein [Lachnospiraceae bacterium]MCI7190171.1 lactate utilization protein [Lachnospiraceae bacterium]MDD7628309.1 lactate utilization protein [Lachnospiraceae bacterium]MDY4118412.1 lactate utilization protein [Lachnospiraceae bacterium]